MDECVLNVVRDRHGKYVHFAALPAVFHDLDGDPGEVVNRAADPAWAERVLTYAQRLVSLRMRHEERTLTGMLATPEGLVVRNDPPRGRM
jgi:hypothetical protein